MVMADEQDDTPFGQKMWERIVDREREELRTKRAGSKLLWAVIDAKPETLPAEVREARKALLDRAEQGTRR